MTLLDEVTTPSQKHIFIAEMDIEQGMDDICTGIIDRHWHADSSYTMRDQSHGIIIINSLLLMPINGHYINGHGEVLIGLLSLNILCVPLGHRDEALGLNNR